MTRRASLALLGFAAVAVSVLTAAWFTHAARGPAFALTPASVGFAPSSSTLVMGAAAVPTVDITVANVSNLGGYDAWISFNGSVVKLSSLADSGFVASTKNNIVICATPTITGSYAHTGCATVPFFSFTPGPGVSAGMTPMALLHASFSPLAPGTSPLALTAVINLTPVTTTLLDPSGAPIVATLSTGSIIVSGNSVGGVAQAPDVGALPQADAGASRGGPIALYLVAGAALAALSVTAAGVWYARLRRR